MHTLHAEESSGCVKTHTALPQTVNSVEGSAPNCWKCLMGCLGGFLAQALFESES